MLPLPTYTQLLATVGLVLFQTAHATPPGFSPQPPISNTTTRNRIETCTFQPNWVPNIVRYEDCVVALEIFRIAEATKSGTQRFEFVARNAPQTTTLLPLQTPRKYRHMTCTVAVAMLSTFPTSYIPPHEKRQVFRPTDVATLNELQAAARNVVMDCVRNPRVRSRPTVGWTPQGQVLNLGIAVAIWETGSLIDRLITRGVEIGLNRSGIVDVDMA